VKTRQNLNKMWTTAEIDYLQNNYSRKTCRQIATALSRSADGVSARAVKMGLRKYKIKGVSPATVAPEQRSLPITNNGSYALVCRNDIERRFSTLDELNGHVKAFGTDGQPVRLLHMVKVATDLPLA